MTGALGILRRFWRYTRGERRGLLLGGLCALAVAASELGTVAVFGIITDRVLARGQLAAFWGPAGWWLAIVAAAGAAMFAGRYLTTRAAERFALRLRDEAFARAQRLPPDFFDRRDLGDLMVRLTADVDVIEAVTASGAAGAVTSAASAALLAAAAAVISWQLALVACAVAPVFWLASRGFSGRLQAAAERQRAVTGTLTSAIEESLANQALVQAFNRQPAESRRLHQAGAAWLRARLAEVRLSAVYASATYVTETLCVLVVFGFGTWQLTRGQVTLGGLLAFAILLAYLYAPVQALAGYRLTVAEAAEPAARLTEILDAAPAVADGTAVPGPVCARGVIAFQQVSFAYPESGRPVLAGLSFRAAPGTVTAITGPSGTGKSTIAKLLLRFYDPDAGRVLLDGADIRDLPLAALRDNITLLQQENLLFSGTIAENIGYGKHDATPAEITAAARAAGAHEFITALPGGYHTPVGQRGRLLSGGQRQRIAIARAALRAAPVLILDEPTTGLSPADSRRVMRLLQPVMAGRTTIIITHDTTVTAAADHVITIGTRATYKATA